MAKSSGTALVEIIFAIILILFIYGVFVKLAPSVNPTLTDTLEGGTRSAVGGTLRGVTGGVLGGVGDAIGAYFNGVGDFWKGIFNGVFPAPPSTSSTPSQATFSAGQAASSAGAQIGDSVDPIEEDLTSWVPYTGD